MNKQFIENLNFIMKSGSAMKTLLPSTLFLVLTCIGLSSAAQQNDKSDSVEKNKLSIELSPLSLLDVYDASSLRIGVEANLYKNLSVYIEGSQYFLINNNFFNLEGRMSNVKGNIIKGEIKYYLNQYSEWHGYLSIQGFYKKQSFDWQDSIHLTPAYLTTFREFKSVYAFDVKYGQQRIYKKRFIFEWYIGIGVRFKDVTSTLTPAQQGSLQYSDDNQWDSDLLGDIANPIGKSIVPDLDLGIRIGYLILR